MSATTSSLLSFQTPLDIANRACQHVGVSRLASLTEDSRAAGEIVDCYDKLRRAEMRRNVWRFSIRRAILYPVDYYTMLLVPPVWSSTTTYTAGQIVSDSNGILWMPTVSPNLNHTPSSDNTWDRYFGPLTAEPWVSSTNVNPTTNENGGAYFAGDLVYKTDGAGTFTVFRSLVSNNSDDPAVADTWLPSSTYQAQQVVQVPAMWASGTTYPLGAIVGATDGLTYTSLIAGNVGNQPALGASPAAWSVGAVVPLVWVSTTAYAVGQVVLSSDTYTYTALVASTGTNPAGNAAPATWAQGGTVGTYQSLISQNTANLPPLAPAPWSSTTTYATGAVVGASDGLTYTSRVNGNHDVNPANGANPTDWTAGPIWTWTSTITGGSGSLFWVNLNATLQPFNVVYPAGTGPLSQTSTANLFVLPAGFLRKAPQDPKNGVTPWLGAPGQTALDDWEFESGFLISNSTGPLTFRFVADCSAVPWMDDMFCEGLAARIALEICETLTQSPQKLVQLEGIYNKFMGEARLVNGIETSIEEPPLDEYIAVRL